MPKIVIPKGAQEAFRAFCDRGRVLFFSAPCGFGKTAVADALLEGKPVLRLSAERGDFALPAAEDAWELLLIDDLQAIQEEETLLALCALIRSLPERRFVLLSRGTPPGCLMAFQYTGLMTVLGPRDLLLDRENIRQLFLSEEVPVTDGEIAGIAQESIGYPLGVVITAQCMRGGESFSPDIVAQAFRQVYFYFETAIYQRFDLPLRRFLLELAPFETFDLEMARMVSGDPHAGELLDWLQRYTTMLLCDGIRRFHFWPQFRDFLLWEMEREYTDEKRRALFNRGGLYYELKEDYSHALECYTLGGDHSKVSELLIRNAELHPGMGHYSEMEKYYRSLPESEILASPSLMQGMSMLCALSADYEGSERWYRALEEFAARCPRQDAAGKQARSRLAWLDISLPQRPVDSLAETIPAVFRLMTAKEVALPPFSVTSTLPSILNGGKDFSPWTRRDDLLYRTIRIPVEAVLGRDGVGLGDAALVESKFEQGEGIVPRMLTLLARQGDIQRSGTPDIEFAVVGLLARGQLAAGRPDDAREMIRSLRARFGEEGHSRFFPNMDALLCRIDLAMGDLDAVERWYRDSAPRDPLHINIMKRYQYFTQAMAELALGRTEAALFTLAPLESYCESCARYIDGLTLAIIRAVALYRRRDESWRHELDRALDTAQQFQYIRPVSVFGAAILPLLEERETPDRSPWYRRLMADVRAQAAFYPAFLEPRMAPAESLTAAEMQVLRLLCAGKSNADIGRIMNIKLTTVKTHVSHVLEKLEVSRRSEVRAAAKKLWLIPEDL